MHRAIGLVALLLATAWAGCATTDGPATASNVTADIDWPAQRLFVTVTSYEKGETPGTGNVSWTPTGVGLDASDTGALHTRLIVLGDDQIYLTFAQMAWAVYPIQDLADLPDGSRFYGWDLRKLTQHPTFVATRTTTASGDHIDGQGTFTMGSRTFPYALTMDITNGRIQHAFLDIDGARETPFTFEATTKALPFPIAKPAKALPRAEILQKDALASEGHAFIVNLVREYAKNHANSYPSTIDPETLRVELLVSGKPWPKNVYTNNPLAVGESSGAFRWVRCGNAAAYYAAYGWDGIVFDQNFGSGKCP